VWLTIVPKKLDPKHRGFAFITFSSSADAQDAIDNMDMNELKRKILKVNLARPIKTAVMNPQSNRAGALANGPLFPSHFRFSSWFFSIPVWESEEWLQEHVKPLAQAGGVQSRFGQSDSKGAETEEGSKQDEDAAMEE
jgi:peptidyl-prolyl isomerase E (cyclophilin E)